jgi:hypothetical protein
MYITEPRSCKLHKEDLADNLSVLFFMEGLFYEGTLHAIQPPDMYVLAYNQPE